MINRCSLCGDMWEASEGSTCCKDCNGVDFEIPLDIEDVRVLLVSYFYELARDHITVGVLNKMLTNARMGTTYCDIELRTWAESHVNKIFGKVRKETK